MVSQRRPLSEAQLAQRRAASQAAATRRRERGLTEAELAQRRAASQRSQVVREERLIAARIEVWDSPAARSERRTVRREFNREARQIGIVFTEARKEGRLGEAEVIALDVREANRRALEVRGIPVSMAAKHGLLGEDWNSKGIQTVLRKLDNLLAKGFTVQQGLEELERRAHKIQDLYREDRNSNLMILAREFYTRQQRLDRQRRRNQQQRQRRQGLAA